MADETPKRGLISDQEFKRLMKRAQTASTISQQLETNREFFLETPVEIGMKLNNACNLRCKHCYEWNEDGFHHTLGKDEKNAELSLDAAFKLLEFTQDSRANVYLWGGEPLIYSKLNELMAMIGSYQRWTTLCTNGILIPKRLAALLPHSENLALLVSIDGLREANDAIRGTGTYDKILGSIQMLIALRETGEYRGAIAVSLTINDSAIPHLAEFVQTFEDMGVDSVYLAFPWFIPPAVSREMDVFSMAMMPNRLPVAGNASWNSFSFHISENLVSTLIEEMQEVHAKSWGCHVRFQPHLTPEEVTGFVLGSKDPAEKKQTCHAIRRRLDVLPNSDVVSCKFFPESKVGNLNTMTASEIWGGRDFQKVRNCIADGLSPVCSKCGLLYTFG